MNPELDQSNKDKRSNTSMLKRIGETVLSIGAAYVGLKIGEDIFHIALSYPVEMGISTAVGSASVNIRYSNLECRNGPTEQ